MKDVLSQLARDLKSEKLRTFLTIFGIVWGTVAISLMLAFGTGLHKQLIKATAGLGDRIVIAWPGLTSVPFEGLGKGRKIRITDDDLATARVNVQGLKAISAEYSNNLKVQYGTKTLSVDTSGVAPEFGSMRNLIPQSGGRFIDDIDLNEQRRTAFIGNKLAKDIFGETPAVGKTITVNQSPFLVVGVLVEKDQDSSYSGRDNEKMFVPSSTFRALNGDKYVDNFVFQAAASTDTKAVIENLRTALGGRLRFDAKDKEALSMWNTTEQFEFFDTFMLAFNAFLGIIGVLTLVVGGIGVSNIMNVVVEERTREIGIKMALGAKQRWILRQFLIETMLVTFLGGAIGFAISLSVCAIFPKFGLAEYVGNPEVSPLVAALTSVALGLVGLVAGYFPARDAARLDPVVAMKL
ncbi:MAG: putative transport system permease protein [Thermoanaerobaculia bacterium]|jgi:putative ABC transport system permease protein|nr:putative transport system permease protein [Thermoanaerobaculia bacterium]